MAFTDGYTNAIEPVKSGEDTGGVKIVIGDNNFENGLTVGRFAQYKAGVLSNADATADPVMAGVVKRVIGNPLEAGSNLNKEYVPNASFYTLGLVTVDAVTEATPSPLAPMYVIGDATANAGKVTAVEATNIPTTAKFVAVVNTDVWLISLV